MKTTTESLKVEHKETGTSNIIGTVNEQVGYFEAENVAELEEKCGPGACLQYANAYWKNLQRGAHVRRIKAAKGWIDSKVRVDVSATIKAIMEATGLPFEVASTMVKL